MASTPDNPMEYIWDRIPKQKDGKTIRYIKGDLEYLYTHGFVDSKKYKLEEWKQAFVPYQQKDEGYILNKEQFLALRMYRYNGPSDEVFNSFKIKDGPWTDKQLQLLYDRSIGVASNVTSETFWAYVNDLKQKGRVDENGSLIITPDVKLGFDALVKRYPSPRTILELEVRRLRKDREQKMAGNQKNINKSGFSVGQTQKENQLDALKALQAKATVKEETPLVDENTETIDLKSLRKPRGHIKG